VEVYGSKKYGVAWNHQGQGVGRLHVAPWAKAETVRAADLGDGTDDPRDRAGPAAPRAGMPAGTGTAIAAGGSCVPTPGTSSAHLPVPRTTRTSAA
jgi:hypothetical protein